MTLGSTQENRMSQKAVTLHPTWYVPAESTSSLESSEEFLVQLYSVPFKTVDVLWALYLQHSLLFVLTSKHILLPLNTCYLQFPTTKYSQVSPIASLNSIRHKLSRIHKKLKTKPIKPHLCLQLQELWSHLRIPLTGLGTASFQAVQIS